MKYIKKFENNAEENEVHFNKVVEAPFKWKATYLDGHVESAETGTTSIANNEIPDKANLVKVEIGDTVASIGNYVFSGSTSLTSVKMPDTLTSIGSGTFYNCSGLTSVSLPSALTSLGSFAFYGCGVTSITIPNGITSIARGAFQKCGLTKVNSNVEGECNLPNGISGLYRDAFNGCTGFTTVILPSTVTRLGEDNDLDGFGQSFYGCTNLVSVTCLATTAPVLASRHRMDFDNTNGCPLYCPADSINSYKSTWSEYASRILPIV